MSIIRRGLTAGTPFSEGKAGGFPGQMLRGLKRMADPRIRGMGKGGREERTGKKEN